MRVQKFPLVMATTGISEEQVFKEGIFPSDPHPVFSKMSLRQSLLELVQTAAKLLYSNFDIEIVERHQ